MMVMGIPVNPRYRESYSVAYNQDVRHPFAVDIFRKQIEALENAGKTILRCVMNCKAPF